MFAVGQQSSFEIIVTTPFLALTGNHSVSKLPGKQMSSFVFAWYKKKKKTFKMLYESEDTLQMPTAPALKYLHVFLHCTAFKGTDNIVTTQPGLLSPTRTNRHTQQKTETTHQAGDGSRKSVYSLNDARFQLVDQATNRK